MLNKKAQLTLGLHVTAVYVYEDPYGRKPSSAKNPTLEPNITSIGKVVAKLWPYLYIHVGHKPPSWIFEIRTWNHWIGQPRKPHPRTKHYVSMLYTAGVMLV